MTLLEEIHDLIHSLNASEKSRFLHFAQSGSRKPQKYAIALFQQLAQSKEVPTESALNIPHLPSLQTRLLNLVLAALGQSHQQDAASTHLFSHLREIEFLMEKNRLKLAGKRLRWLKKKATRFEAYEIGGSLFRLEEQLYLLAPWEKYEAFFERIEKESKEWAGLHQRQNILNRLQTRIRMMAQRNAYVRTVSAREECEWVVNEARKYEITPQSPFWECIYGYNIEGLYQIMIGEFSLALSWFQKGVHLWRKRPEFILLAQDLYLGMYNNFVTALLHTQPPPEIYKQAVEELEAETGFLPHFQFKKMRITYQHELNYHLYFGQLVEGKSRLLTIENWLNAPENPIALSRKISMIYNMVVYFFLYGEFSEANLRLRDLIALPKGPERKDIRNFAPLLYALVQYELGQKEVDEYGVKALVRFLKREGMWGQFEKRWVEILSTPNVSTLDLQRLLAWMELNTSEVYKYNAVGIPLIEVWIKASLSGISLMEVFRKGE